MSNKNFNSSVLERNRQSRAIYSNYRINMLGIEQGIPANPISIKGGSADITQALVQGPVVFTPAELTAILNNNSGSTAASGSSGPATSVTFTSASPPTFPYTIPAVYTLLTFTLIGGGGGGGGNYDFPMTGGGGGGAYIRARSSVNAGDIIRFTVGEGGAGAITNDQTTSGSGATGNFSSFIYNDTEINIFAGGGSGGTGGGTGVAGGTVTGDTSSVTILQSVPGFPGGNSTGDFSSGYTPGEGGLAGNNILGPGAGGGYGGNIGGITGSNGYWEFTLT